MARCPGIEKVTRLIEQADGRSESVLETLGRLACIEGDLPVPISNTWLADAIPSSASTICGDGPSVAMAHLWRWHWVVAEADGALKYRDQDDLAEVVAAEKERQWFLERELGLTVIRYGWDLAFGDRDELAARFRAVLADNPPRSAPVPWWPRYDLHEGPIMA